ncbi:MAG: endolytic transglycosylase MltG [Alphaproteobacteria bacterium]|uniref:Endolytic murein transglycosylase n=1 Tax=Candidatus Nitrobium versatile TaxID=2884831 RepID=A0A953M374_9BACT|nr:endolytic transglycosylase MltG [Candidatus Nitrobium versatile]
MKKNLKIILFSIGSLFLAYAGLQLFVPTDWSGRQVEIRIPEGATYRQALSLLARNNLIRDKNLFILIGKLSGFDKRVRAGYYSFFGRMAPYQVFKRLRDGKIIEYEVAVLEGESLPEIGAKLAGYNIASFEEFTRISRDPDFLRQLDVQGPSLEGYLFPQTYKIPKGVSPRSVLKVMVRTLREEFNSTLRERARELGWSENEVLTLASIIEKEAVADSERPVISAVYHNRILRRMPLQADPTAIYGVKSSREKITPQDLRKKTEYNTYMIKGLPPGPIASPGKKSILAALYPAEVPYLYFVSQGNGTHYFSKTLAEHSAAIRRLRAQKAALNGGTGEGIPVPASDPGEE